MKVTENQCAGLRNRRAIQPVAMKRRDGTAGPSLRGGKCQVAEFAGEGPIVIAAHGDDLRTLRKKSEGLFDISAFWFAGTGGVYQIAHENDKLRFQFCAKLQQFVASLKISKRTQLAATALRPTVAQMQIGH
jgi:hypothetical protein